MSSFITSLHLADYNAVCCTNMKYGNGNCVVLQMIENCSKENAEFTVVSYFRND